MMIESRRTTPVVAVALAALLAALPGAAQAQVYKCQQANGTMSFQSTPCPGDRKAAPVVAAPPKPAASRPFKDPYAQAPGSGQRGTLNQPAQRAAAAAAGAEAQAADNLNPRERWLAQKKLDDEARAKADAAAQNDARDKELARLQGENRATRCNVARINLNVLSQQHPVFRVDNSGNRNYVSDENRQAEIANAQRQVAQYCP